MFCRLDLWLASHHLQDEVKAADIVSSIRSDHSAVNIELSDIEQVPRGPGHWKLNTSLLKNEQFVSGMKEKILSVLESDSSHIEDKRVLWDWLKFNAKDFAIKLSKQLARERRSQENILENLLESSIKELERTHSEESYKCYEEAKHKLEAHYEKKVEGIKIRSKIRWYEQGEKSTKYFLRLEKRNFTRKNIRKLQINQSLSVNCADIQNEILRFYKELYSSKAVKLPSDESRLFCEQENIPKLSENSRLACETEVSLQECTAILESFKSDKSPGNDGLPAEFYTCFWNEIQKPFFRMHKL